MPKNSRDWFDAPGDWSDSFGQPLFSGVEPGTRIRLKIVSLHLGGRPTQPQPQAPMKTHTTRPGGDENVVEGPVISYGSGLGPGWHSHFIGHQELIFDSGGSIWLRVYANTRVPASLPTWPRALSLRPDLSERIN